MKLSKQSIPTATPARIAANRANAQRSTGPKTPAGKAVSAMNHFRHGLTGEFRILAWEDEADFDKLLDGLTKEHKPSTVTETVLIEKMARALWLSQRAQTLQHGTLNREVITCWGEKKLALYIRYQITNDRAFYKALNEFLKLRAETRKAEIGFESQQRKREEDERRRSAELRKQADFERRAAAENRKQELHKYAVSLAEAKVDRQRLQNSILPAPNGLAFAGKESRTGVQKAA